MRSHLQDSKSGRIFHMRLYLGGPTPPICGPRASNHPSGSSRFKKKTCSNPQEDRIVKKVNPSKIVENVYSIFLGTSEILMCPHVKPLFSPYQRLVSRLGLGNLSNKQSQQLVDHLLRVMSTNGIKMERSCMADQVQKHEGDGNQEVLLPLDLRNLYPHFSTWNQKMFVSSRT